MTLTSAAGLAASATLAMTLLAGEALAQGAAPPPLCGTPGYPCPSPGYGLPTYPNQYGQPTYPNQYGQPTYTPQYGQPPYPPQYSQPSYPYQQGYRPPVVQPPPPPAPQRTWDDDDARRLNPDDDGGIAVLLDLVSLRVGTYDIRGSDADARTWGFLLALDPDIVLTVDYFTMRSTWFAAIGGGSDGLEGQLENSETFGVRGYFGDAHGPFARLGFAYQLMGNNKLYRSFVELPRGEVGYQVLADGVLFEVAGRAGLVLGGRFFTGDHAERRIDSELAWGGIATLQVDPFRIHAAATRIQAGQTAPGTPIDQLDASLCANPWKGLLFCGHGAFHRGDVVLPGGAFRESTATYFGGTLGYGWIETAGGG